MYKVLVSVCFDDFQWVFVFRDWFYRILFFFLFYYFVFVVWARVGTVKFDFFWLVRFFCVILWRVVIVLLWGAVLFICFWVGCIFGGDAVPFAVGVGNWVFLCFGLTFLRVFFFFILIVWWRWVNFQRVRDIFSSVLLVVCVIGCTWFAWAVLACIEVLFVIFCWWLGPRRVVVVGWVLFFRGLFVVWRGLFVFRGLVWGLVFFIRWVVVFCWFILDRCGFNLLVRFVAVFIVLFYVGFLLFFLSCIRSFWGFNLDGVTYFFDFSLVMRKSRLYWLFSFFRVFSIAWRLPYRWIAGGWSSCCRGVACCLGLERGKAKGSRRSCFRGCGSKRAWWR